MYELESIINTIIKGNSLDVLRQMPDACIDMAITSPPYFGKRDYTENTTAIWGGKHDCEHVWGNDIKPAGYRSNENRNSDTLTPEATQRRDTWQSSTFCSKCSAWKGQLGLEPTPSLYIQHLVQIFSEVMRVLKPYGSLYVNLGDTYAGYWGNQNGDGTEYGNLPVRGHNQNKRGKLRAIIDEEGIQPKSQMCIPERFVLEMIKLGFIKRNTNIWFKRNTMPYSGNDRYTEDFEYVFFFTKSSEPLYWTNEKTLQLVTKSPRGTGGIEGTDWDWIPCPKCNKPKETIQASLEEPDETPQQDNGACKRCGGIGKIKQSYWQSHDYYFEQQFDPYTEPLNRWGGTSLKANGNSSWDTGTGQDTYRDRSMRPNALGRNKRTVWDIPECTYSLDVDGEMLQITASELQYLLKNRMNGAKGSVWDIVTKPMKEAHYASYPSELIETPIRASCSEFVCKKCGMPRVKVFKGNLINEGERDGVIRDSDTRGRKLRCGDATNASVGYATYNCNEGFAPGVVLDMFMGSGTTAIVAKELGRRFIGSELNPEYIKIAEKRIGRIKGAQKSLEIF